MKAEAATNQLEGKTPFNGECRGCGHVFVVCWLPMPLDAAARLMKAAACPLCAGRKIFIHTANGGTAEHVQA